VVRAQRIEEIERPVELVEYRPSKIPNCGFVVGAVPQYEITRLKKRRKRHED
jgi:hypothetical protein